MRPAAQEGKAPLDPSSHPKNNGTDQKTKKAPTDQK